jgi:HEAT repeat protein
MKKRMLRMSVGVLVGLGVLVVGVWILSCTLGTGQKLYEGKSCYYWSLQLTNRDAAISNKATAILYSRIIPHLTNELCSAAKDSKFKLALIKQLNELPGVQIYFEGADQRRAQAAFDLAAFGPKAKGAAPALLAVLKGQDDTLYRPAARALASIGADPEAAIPVLIGRLVDRDGHGRPDVVDALAEFGPRAKAAVPTLVKLLKDRSSKDIIRAVPRALRRIDPESVPRAGSTN